MPGTVLTRGITTTVASAFPVRSYVDTQVPSEATWDNSCQFTSGSDTFKQTTPSAQSWISKLSTPSEARRATAMGGCKFELVMDGDNKIAISPHEFVGRLSEDVDELHLRVRQGSYVGSSLFFRILQRCILQKDLVLGKRVHELTVKCGYDSNQFLANHLICMYASHGRVDDAMQVFIKVAAPNTHMWASIILAYARHGQSKEAIKLYHQMQQSGVRPDSHVYVAMLKACACERDLTSGYAEHGLAEEALSLYARMQKEGIKPIDKDMLGKGSVKKPSLCMPVCSKIA